MNCPDCDKETEIHEITVSFCGHTTPSSIQVHIICTECETEYGSFIYQQELCNYTEILHRGNADDNGT